MCGRVSVGSFVSAALPAAGARLHANFQGTGGRGPSGSTAVLTRCGIKAVSRQRERHLFDILYDGVSPQGKILARRAERLDEESDEQFALNPGSGGCNVRLFQVAQAHDGFEPLESDFDLPGPSVHFQNRDRRKLALQCREYNDLCRGFQGFRLHVAPFANPAAKRIVAHPSRPLAHPIRYPGSSHPPWNKTSLQQQRVKRNP